jgi:tetratricopeptide (TPR) repeat protein
MFDYEDFYHLARRAFREPGNAGLFSALLLHTEWLGNYAESRQLYEALTERHPYCGQAWYNLGWTLAGLRQVEGAIEAFEFAYLAQPGLKAAYEACAAWSLLSGRPRRAWLCYDEMMRHMEADVQDLCRLSLCQRLAGDLKKARASCLQALQLDPYHADACYHLAACFVEECAYHQALRWLRQAVRNDEKHASAHQLLAEVYNRIGRPHLAHQHAWRAIEQTPDSAEAWVFLLESLLLQQQPEEAAQAARVALQHTEAAELLYCAAACHFMANRRQQALALLQQAFRSAPERRTLLFRWAPQLLDDEDVQKVLQL